MASEDEPHSELAAQDSGELTAQDSGKLTAQETGELTVQDTGKLITEDTGNTGSDKSTTEKPKKPPPKKPAILQNCELCNVILSSQSIIDAHMASKRHTKKLQAAESMKAILGQTKVTVANPSPYKCDICKITLNSQQQKDLHLLGTKHKYKAQKSAEANEMIPENKTTPAASTVVMGAQVLNQLAGGMVTDTDAAMAVQAADLKCIVCNITVNSVQQLTQHLSSKKHQFKENSAKRQSFNRSRRGGMGRGGPGSFEMPRAPGAFGARGRGRGRGQGPMRGQGPTRGHGPTRGGPVLGQGRGRGGPKSLDVNSLNSNFQSAGFTSNFQGVGGQQSLKRERSDSSFGNGSNDDFSNSSYYQGKKIPRGAQSAPFNSVNLMDSNAFRSGNNAFGGGNDSYGAGNNSFGIGNNSFGAGNSSFSGGKISFGSGNKPFERGSRSPGGGNNSFGRENKSFGGGNNAFGGNSFSGESNSFGGQNNSYGIGNTSFGRSSLGGGNTSFAGGNGLFGVGNSSFGGGKASYGRGVSSFGGGNNFGDYNNSLRSVSGRGNMRGGFEKGRGFANRGGFGKTAQEGGY